MSTDTLTPPMSEADRLAHELASYVRRPSTVAEHDKSKDPQLPTRPRGPHRPAVAS